MFISEITEYTKAKDRISFEDGSFLVVYKGMLPKDTPEISDEEYDRLYKEMLVYAKRRAMNLLVKRDRSVKELTDKLCEDGYNSDIVEAAMSYLDSYHYLDDLRVAKQLVRANREHKSIREIKEILKKHGISESDAEVAIGSAYCEASSEDDEAEGYVTEESSKHEIDVIVSLLKKKRLTPESIASMEYSDRQKLAAGFYRKGFKSENIKTALNMSDFD